MGSFHVFHEFHQQYKFLLQGFTLLTDEAKKELHKPFRFSHGKLLIVLSEFLRLIADINHSYNLNFITADLWKTAGLKSDS